MLLNSTNHWQQLMSCFFLKYWLGHMPDLIQHGFRYLNTWQNIFLDAPSPHTSCGKGVWQIACEKQHFTWTQLSKNNVAKVSSLLDCILKLWCCLGRVFFLWYLCANWSGTGSIYFSDHIEQCCHIHILPCYFYSSINRVAYLLVIFLFYKILYYDTMWQYYLVFLSYLVFDCIITRTAFKMQFTKLLF
jgi:hypothetical protein